MKLALFSLRGREEREEKSFFAKRSHFKTSDIQITYYNKGRYEIYGRSGIGFVIGFDMLKKAPEREAKPFNQSPNRGLCKGFQRLQPGWEIGLAEQKINQSGSAELVCVWWGQTFRHGRRKRLPLSYRPTGMYAQEDRQSAYL